VNSSGIIDPIGCPARINRFGIHLKIRMTFSVKLPEFMFLQVSITGRTGCCQGILTAPNIKMAYDIFRDKHLGEENIRVKKCC
jgi:hypothetical protein